MRINPGKIHFQGLTQSIHDELYFGTGAEFRERRATNLGITPDVYDQLIAEFLAGSPRERQETVARILESEIVAYQVKQLTSSNSSPSATTQVTR